MGKLAVARILEIAKAEGVQIDLSVEEIAPGMPLPIGFKGSPTIFLNGQDLEPAARIEPDSGHG